MINNRWSSPDDSWSDKQDSSVDRILGNMYYSKASQQNKHRGAVAAPAPQIVDGAGPSNSEIFLNSRQPGEVSKSGFDQLSPTRQEYLQEVNARAEVASRPDLGIVEGITKRAGISTQMGGSITPPGNSTHLAPDIYSPLFLTQNLQLPRDRITANAWNRAFYETNPYVRTCINLHSTYPTGKFNIKCDDKDVETFFLDMADKLDLFTVIQNIASEYFKLGEMVDGSSFITMADGTLKKITDIQMGDMVLTHLGNKKKVIEKFIKPTNRVMKDHIKILEIYTSCLPKPLIISGKHPILTSNRKNFICGSKPCASKGMRLLPGRTRCSNCGKTGFDNNNMPDFIESDQLQPWDMVYAPFDKTIIADHDPIFTEDLCYLIGQWLAEGCYTRNSGTISGVKYCSYDREYIYNVLEPLIEKTLNKKPKTYISKSYGFSGSKKTYKLGDKIKDKFDTWVYGKKNGGEELANFFLEHCGQYSKTKKMSETLMTLPPELQCHILAGFLDGDGCIDSTNGAGKLSTSSPHLYNQFLLILRRLGAHPTAYAQSNSRSTCTNYSINIVANEAHLLFKNKLKSKKNNLLKTLKWTCPKSAIQDCWQTLRIREIKDITATYTEDFMYDLEVEDDHSYVANGIAIHNCFPYANFDQRSGTWDQIYLHNPDYIRVKASPIASHSTSISLRPDPELQKIVTSNDPEYIRIREQLDPQVIHHVIMNEYIPLDNFNISHIKNLASPYDVRGTSMIVSVWKDLMLIDKYREAELVQADGMINPLTIVKIGTDGSEGLYPRQEEIDAWRAILEQAQYDKDFKIVTHNAVQIERSGYNAAIIDTTPRVQQLIENILVGLGVPKTVLTQDGASYASATVGLEVLRQRYANFRAMIGNWLEKKIFAPISEIQGFYKLDGGKKRLIIPQVEWNQMTLYDLDTYIGHITGMAGKTISQRTVDRSLGLNRNNENINLRQEAIEQAILLKEKEALANMSLSELRSLDPEAPIVTPEKAPLPGAGLPGASGPEEMPDLSGPSGMPDLGGAGLGGGPTPNPSAPPDLGAAPGGPELPSPPNLG